MARIELWNGDICDLEVDVALGTVKLRRFVAVKVLHRELSALTGGQVTVAHVLSNLRSAMADMSQLSRWHLVDDIDAFERQLRASSDKKLRVQVAELGLPANTQIETLVGTPYIELINAVQSQGFDLVVSGTRGQAGWKRFLVGSTSDRLLRNCPCPVWVVKGGQGQPPRSILVPVDFSDCSLEAVEYAAFMAQRHQATLSLVHVLEPVSYGLDFTLLHSGKREELRERLAARMTGLTTALGAVNIKADSHIRGGVPADSILDSARTIPADLIVMGTHGRRGLSHLLCGSVAEAVLRQSRCPVLTVRSPKYAPGHRRIVTGATTEPTSSPGG